VTIEKSMRKGRFWLKFFQNLKIEYVLNHIAKFAKDGFHFSNVSKNAKLRIWQYIFLNLEKEPKKLIWKFLLGHVRVK
jgi:hypothetical protein